MNQTNTFLLLDSPRVWKCYQKGTYFSLHKIILIIIYILNYFFETLGDYTKHFHGETFYNNVHC